MRLGFRDPENGEKRPKRVLIWESGATTDVSLVLLTLGAVAIFVASVAVALTTRGRGRIVAAVLAVISGIYSAAYLVNAVLAFGLLRIVRKFPNDE